MEQQVNAILDDHRLMAIATLRPDGWPEATMVSYAHEGLHLYFIISRTTQKYANILRDSRISIAIGSDFDDPVEIKGLSIAANASEVRDPSQRQRAMNLLLQRHPGLMKLSGPDLKDSAIMKAFCSVVSILDYSHGFGHSDILTVSPGGVQMAPARDNDWGFIDRSAREPSNP